MAAATANGFDVVECKFQIPRRGLWHADMYIDCPDPTQFASNIAITFEGGPTWTAYALKYGPYLDGVFVRLYGGNGGFGKNVAPKFYQQGTVSHVVNDMFASIGESLASDSTPAVVNQPLSRWTIIQQRPGPALDMITNTITDSLWRVEPSGAIWLGIESWPVVTPEYEVLDAKQHEGRYVFGQEIPTILPGTSIVDPDYGTLQIDRVEAQITTNHVRTSIWVVT